MRLNKQSYRIVPQAADDALLVRLVPEHDGLELHPAEHQHVELRLRVVGLGVGHQE